MIRKAQKPDIEQIASLEQKLLTYHRQFDCCIYDIGSDARNFFSNWLLKRIDDENFVAFVYLDNNLVKGYVTGWIEERPQIYKLRNLGYLSNIYIDENYRNRTTAAKDLAFHLFEWFKQKGINYVKTSCDERNNVAIAFFHSLSFKEYTKIMLKELK